MRAMEAGTQSAERRDLTQQSPSPLKTKKKTRRCMRMSDLVNQRRMAAAILKCGINRVWFDPGRQADIEMAISREDLRELIAGGAIKARVKGNSRGRARAYGKRAYGHQRGPGRRRAPLGLAVQKGMDRKIRAQRRTCVRCGMRAGSTGSLPPDVRRAWRPVPGVAHLTAHVEMVEGRSR